MSTIRELGRPALLALADDLEQHRISPPFSKVQLGTRVPSDYVEGVAVDLEGLSSDGMEPRHIATTLRLLADERHASQVLSDRLELVLSGVHPPGGEGRETAVVVEQLFGSAKERIVIASYAVDSGDRAKSIFGELARRMDEEPNLDVRLFLNIHREFRDQTPSSHLIREFSESFRSKVWPGKRLPQVFHDPRSLQLNSKKKAVLHAKCIVVDGSRALVTSANFTEAAHERNVEAGVVVDDAAIARALEQHFNKLVETGDLEPLFGTGA